MSGDSPNAFTNENVFDFKEARASPTPTTSKDHNNYVTASVLVEPSKDKLKEEQDDDQPDFSTPILNPGDKEKKNSESSKTLEMNDPKTDDNRNEKKDGLLNNGLDRLPKTHGKPKELDEDSDDDTCIVNCVYYTMECCKCAIL